MATYTVQTPSVAGITPSYTAVASSDSFAMASGHAYLLHVKATGSTTVVTVDDPITSDPGAATAFNPDAAISVTGGQERMILLAPSRFKHPTTGICTINYSVTASVTAAVFLVGA